MLEIRLQIINTDADGAHTKNVAIDIKNQTLCMVIANLVGATLKLEVEPADASKFVIGTDDEPPVEPKPLTPPVTTNGPEIVPADAVPEAQIQTSVVAIDTAADHPAVEEQVHDHGATSSD